jgi:hypothetical protein
MSELLQADRELSPWPVRLAVFVVMAVVALAAIWLIDRRAMARMEEMQDTSVGVEIVSES